MKLLRSQKAGVLIGMLMLLIGLGAFSHAVKITIDQRSMKNWVPHLARVESAALVTHTNDKGGKSYSIDVSYLFEWEGTSYKGARYRLHDKTNPTQDGIFKEVKSLLMFKQEGRLYPIFVNPNNPAQSAIRNTVHPKARSGSLFLGFLFSIIGCFTVFKPKLFKKRAEA